MCKLSVSNDGVKVPPRSLAPDKTRNARVEPSRQSQSQVWLVMEGQKLLHLQLQVDPLEPRAGVLELLGRLRPHWDPQHVHMKVTGTTA